MAIRENTFLLKRSNVPGKVPLPGDIQLGEVALNTADVKLYASGTTENDIIQIGWDRISRTGDTVTGDFMFNGDLSATTISATTYYGDGSNLTGVYPSTNPSGFTSNVGTVTSVGLSMPSAFTVANSPVTTNGTLTVSGAGLTSQYVRGDGSLANFPASTGGGASLSFYLNGSVSQGTFGGISFREMDRTPILGAGTDFTINADGYIQSFITDASVPNLLEIPAGNWNFETYFSASSGGGSPSFYVELYKWNGTILSLIASNSANPEYITNGTNTDLYVSALAVPQTTLLATDRLAVRIYVTHSGRTIKLHTENGHLCQVITTFSTGLTALNGLTTQVQNFSVGTTGTDFGINSSGATHTFNLPTASAANRGALSSTDWSTFNSKQDALVSGTNIKTVNSSSLLGSGNLSVGTVTSVAALTLGTSGTDVSSTVASGTTTPVITLNIPTASASNRGVLSSTDWSTFNNKLSATISSPLGGDLLTYNSTSSVWQNSKTLNGNYVVNGDLNVTGTTTLNTLVVNNITPNVQTVSSSATVTPTSTNNLVVITAQAATLTLANPTGVWSQGQDLIIRIKDNGTSRTINYGNNYRAIGTTLPTSTTANKTIYLGIIYNSTDTKWDIVGVNIEE